MRSMRFASHAVGEDLYVEVAFAGAVELGKEDALPAAEGEFAFFNKDELRCTDKHGLHMRIGISLGVTIGASRRNKAVERSLSIGGHVRIGVLVNQNPSSGVRDVQVARSSLDAQRRYHALHLHCDVNYLGTADSSDYDRLHGVSIMVIYGRENNVRKSVRIYRRGR